jgi:isochorismate synthase
MEKVFLTKEDMFVAFSLPGENDIQLYLHDEKGKHEFVIHPFIRKSVDTTFIKSSSVLFNPNIQFKNDTSNSIKETKKSDYTSQAFQLLQNIEHGQFSKAILSRIKTVDLSNPDYGSIFKSLVNTYQKAFCYFFNIPGQGSWMGASPEVLLKSNVDGFETVALAGTLANPEFGDPAWTTKEKEEQQIIVDYVKEKLDARNIDYTLKGPRNSVAGKVVHLKSVFASNQVIDPVDVALALHPGPAISGFPVDKALDFISRTELHKRDYYCGFLGPVSDSHTTLFINLRCMQLFEKSVSIYVGGGLTKDSIVESEWEETELKSQTLLSVLEDSYLAVNGIK